MCGTGLKAHVRGERGGVLERGGGLERGGVLERGMLERCAGERGGCAGEGRMC